MFEDQETAAYRRMMKYRDPNNSDIIALRVIIVLFCICAVTGAVVGVYACYHGGLMFWQNVKEIFLK